MISPQLGPFSPEELWLPFYAPPSQAPRKDSPADPPDRRGERKVWAYLGRKRRFPVLAAYDLCLKCSHLFNILDARGAISVTERVGVIARVRALAVGIAKAWVDQQVDQQQKLQNGGEPEKSEEPEPVRKGKGKREKFAPVG